ncbi:MAG: bifunctional phosphoribosylaminoimidazolecarboxamide formyltransferase/IMP cyclohydrolase [Candidatus Lokiarchaeota archaeon]|nr:bifunctional phosphoribosylaminoimidazolecarboxamide formyltransferase/IMP cyclohydrolase [Candidatus Lokiarchaeota archaeon]MBD3339005.1 bifunctional phosphoribosylaminoimidazolecarboxamide formyltransferase/IMP cyclohydrolase [Candidatus Lokiarchaeota archaeon]
MKKIERVLVSVFDKANIFEFVNILVNEFKVEILSTGGTGRLLEEKGIEIKKISQYTGSPEMFDGRVKTLHPKIEGGILYRRDVKKDVEDAEKYDIPPIDMVVCNLYQFKEAIEKPGTTLQDALELIDIGGPTMIRAAAKNFPDVIVVPHPEYYDEIINELRKNKGAITEKTRLKLAQDVFSIMADYNAAISNYLQQVYEPNALLPNTLLKVYNKVQDCRYGENWDQNAAYYQDVSAKYGLHSLKQLGGKEISFNNYLDIDSCMHMLLDFGKKNYVTAILKHTSPNGIAMDEVDQLKSVKKAFSCDPMSAFGGIWGVNKELSKKVADFIVNKKNIFVEVIMAPSYEPKALEILETKQNMRILEFGNLLEKREELYKNLEIRSTLGGTIVQEYDYKPVVKEWNVVSKKNVDSSEKEALIFAYKVSKWAKSNSACFVQIYDTGIYTIGIGAGQQSRVHVVKLAAQKAKEFGHKDAMEGSYMGTDSFFPFPDGLEAAVEAGAKAIINPGGSIRDDLVIQRADELECALVFCGKRVFRH